MRRFLVGVLLSGLMHAASAASPPVILVMGDSLSAAHGIPVASCWVQLLQARLRQQGYPHRVVNGSVSGETTAGGLARLPAALKQHQPDVVLIELGGNDGLRGLPVKQLRANLAQMAALTRKAGAQPVLFEMRIPPNYGVAYTDAFQQTFAAVAREHQAPLVPFFLDDLIDQPGTFQDDGIHPTVSAQPRMLEAAWPTLQKLLPQSRPASKPATKP
jgi:acyl-CoA thioesterase I